MTGNTLKRANSKMDTSYEDDNDAPIATSSGTRSTFSKMDHVPDLPTFVVFENAKQDDSQFTQSLVTASTAEVYRTSNINSTGLKSEPKRRHVQAMVSMGDRLRNNRKKVSFSDHLTIKDKEYVRSTSTSSSRSDDLGHHSNSLEYFDSNLLWYSDHDIDQFEQEAQRDCNLITWRMHYRKIMQDSSSISFEHNQNHHESRLLQKHPPEHLITDTNMLLNVSANMPQLAFDSKSRGLEYYYCTERLRRRQGSIQYIIRAFHVLRSQAKSLIHEDSPCIGDDDNANYRLAKVAQRCTKYATELAIEEASRDYIRAYGSSLSSSYEDRTGNVQRESLSMRIVDSAIDRRYNNGHDEATSSLPIRQHHHLVVEEDSEMDHINPTTAQDSPLTTVTEEHKTYRRCVSTNERDSGDNNNDDDDDDSSIIINKKHIYSLLREYKIQNGFSDDIWDLEIQNQPHYQPSPKRIRLGG